MDETGQETAVEQQDGQAAVAEQGAPASGAERETESNWMNRALRAAAGVLGFGDSDGRDQETETPPQATDDGAPPAPIAQTEADIEARITREAQSRADRLDAQRRWDAALAAADANDPSALQELAEQGNKRAARELSNRGLTYERGAAEAKADAIAQQHEAQTQVFDQFRVAWDAAVLQPVLDSLPAESRDKILAEGVAGIEGRTKAVNAALGEIRRLAKAGAATDLLSNEKFVGELLKEGSAFRKKLLSDPVTNKRLRAIFRPELEEPDLIPSLGRARGGERENDVMNDLLREAAGLALERAPEERAAMAGGRNGRLTNRDLLADDE